ncbi:carbohydrate ABC transporter permease [Cellulomonas edaphi]|uniref:Carbohydrate ABC transporter permease n=1 Tax=Cellulomonas edaphi TaxID=3053468 RepID=A0ABT7S838_9CELL|nr:carbohydrate ABC transporter permease [Cellulomons edaphi]MDM7831798.1 carbohydrate ABC transporter permease [Cellulomons edaphi]
MPGSAAAAAPSASLAAIVRRRRRSTVDNPDRGALSSADWRRPSVKHTWRSMHFLLLVLLLVWCLGPLLLLGKFAFTPTQDILTAPMAVFPNGPTMHNVDQAWNRYHIGQFFMNTVWFALGAWFTQILVATTGGFVLSVLRPRWAKVLNWAVLATLFVPAVVLLIPLYKIIVHPPVGDSLVNNFFAVWLPAGASAFNVVLVARFFDSLPREIFEAARVDGAGPFRLFWHIVLPMSKPIIGVVSVFAVIASWKDFLWPFLVLKDDSVKPLSVYLQSMANVDKGTLMAALAISTLIPITMFLVFQRMFLRGAGLGGAVKG